MKINDTFEVTVWGVLVVIGVVGTVVASGTWVVAKTVESNELEAYRKAKEWKASEAITAITELSKTAKTDASERSELLVLRGSKEQTEKLLTEAKTQVTKLQLERDEARQSLASIVKAIDTIEVPKGEARFLVSNTVAVGVIAIYTSMSKCEIRVGERSRMLDAGEVLSFPFGGQQYSLTLLKLSANACTFSFAQASHK